MTSEAGKRADLGGVEKKLNKSSGENTPSKNAPKTAQKEI